MRFELLVMWFAMFEMKQKPLITIWCLVHAAVVGNEEKVYKNQRRARAAPSRNANR